MKSVKLSTLNLKFASFIAQIFCMFSEIWCVAVVNLYENTRIKCLGGQKELTKYQIFCMMSPLKSLTESLEMNNSYVKCKLQSHSCSVPKTQKLWLVNMMFKQ